VTRPAATARRIARETFLVLATLAIVLKILIPAGFMTAPEPRNGLPFALVLCTGQGLMVAEPGAPLGEKHGSPADRAGHDTPCPFAAQATPAPPPSDLIIARVEFVTFQPAPPVKRVHLAPGRGLAAPPLPARGPPSLLI